MSDAPSKTTEPRDKVRGFPTTPGVYLMKDAQGRVIYVGKAKNLRARAGSYFLKAAADDRRICDWIGEVADVEYLAADSEVDALLLEARLIKDIQPKHNKDLKDDRSFPYLQITTGDDFPRVNFTRTPLRQAGSSCTARSLGPRASGGRSRFSRRFSNSGPARSTSKKDDPRWRWFRPCLLHSIDQCTAPCNLRGSTRNRLPQGHPPAPACSSTARTANVFWPRSRPR